MSLARRLIQVGVGGDNEIQKAVIIGIEQHGARVHFPGRRLQSCLGRVVLKHAVAGIAIDLHAVKAGDKQAHLAAVIKVGKGGGHAGARTGDSRFLRDVAERSISVVVKKVIVGGGDYDIKIRPAVVVIVSYSNGRTEERQEFLAREFPE